MKQKIKNLLVGMIIIDWFRINLNQSIILIRDLKENDGMITEDGAKKVKNEVTVNKIRNLFHK